MSLWTGTSPKERSRKRPSRRPIVAVYLLPNTRLDGPLRFASGRGQPISHTAWTEPSRIARASLNQTFRSSLAPYESNKPSTRLYSTSTGAFGVNGVSTGNDTSLASREFSRPPAHLIPAGNRIARRLVILPRSSDFFSTSYNYFSIFSTGKPRDRSTTSYLSA